MRNKEKNFKSSIIVAKNKKQKNMPEWEESDNIKINAAFNA